MHVYPRFSAPSGPEIVDLVRQNPFAVVATSVSGAAPVATHLPVVLPPDSSVETSFVGHRLWGHMGRSNPHWEMFEEHPDALLIFSSSHAYVSPSSYEFEPAAPTLNYATAHLTGRISVIEAREESLEVVEQTVDALESLRSEAWSKDGSRDYFRTIIGGVVAFTIDVVDESSMFKLSQDMPRDVHSRVRQDLESSGCPHADVAALMRRTGVHEENNDKEDRNGTRD